jgi:hypothetical protein
MAPGNAAPWSEANSAGIRALVVARVVVGIPNMLNVSSNDLATNYPQIVPLTDSSVHSTVVSTGNPHDDGIYVFRDDAVDPLFLVLFV